MAAENITSLDRTLARLCELCPVCRRARATQAGIAFQLVMNIEEDICPFCRAYAKVHGRKAHDPLPGQGD
jgi:hypothetical protein